MLYQFENHNIKSLCSFLIWACRTSSAQNSADQWMLHSSVYLQGQKRRLSEVDSYPGLLVASQEEPFYMALSCSRVLEPLIIRKRNSFLIEWPQKLWRVPHSLPQATTWYWSNDPRELLKLTHWYLPNEVVKISATAQHTLSYIPEKLDPMRKT